jgi:threonine dehydratase
VPELPVTITDIERAAERIAPYVHRTPLVSSASIGSMAGCELWLKAENLQKVGAFKARGAHNAVFALTDAEAGVVTHSSGNHAAAVALAARNRGIEARVVMPSNAPAVKQAAVAGYGATVTLCPPTLEARESTVAEIEARTGAVLIHPYDDDAVIAGQGTVGLEIADQLRETPPDAVVVPVGGGGLLSGVAIAVNDLIPGCRIFGAEPSGADDAYRSFRAGRLIPQTGPDTVADGLLTSLGERNFAIIRALVDDILLVDDKQIIEAMKLIWTRCKLVVEPSGAVAVAAVLAHRGEFAGQRVVAVLTGGNVDLDRLPWNVHQGADVPG